MIPEEDGYYWVKCAKWEVAHLLTDGCFKGIRTIYWMEGNTPTPRYFGDIVEWGPKIEEPI